MTIRKQPLWQLTVEEFINLLHEHSVNYVELQPTKESQQVQRSYVYGISGLAQLINCSKVTAQKIKNSGQIDGCYSQAGRKLVFDADMVLNALKKEESYE